MTLRGTDGLAATNTRREQVRARVTGDGRTVVAKTVDVVKSPGRRSERSAKTGEWEDRGGNKQTKNP